MLALAVAFAFPSALAANEAVMLSCALTAEFRLAIAEAVFPSSAAAAVASGVAEAARVA